MNRSATIVSTVALMLVAGAGSAQGATFFDGIFAPADWTQVTINNATGVGSTGVGFQQLAGGNPNEFRRVRHNLLVQNPGNGAIYTFHMNVNAFYTPSSQGAISYIDYSEDSINFIPDTIVPGNGQGSGLAILQNGKYYRQQNPILVMPYSSFSTWQPNVASGLLATDFAEVDAFGVLNVSSNPDFTITGTTMQLGFWRGNSGNGSYNTDCGIDNWHVNIVPGPGAAALAGLGGLLGARRRRGK